MTGPMTERSLRPALWFIVFFVLTAVGRAQTVSPPILSIGRQSGQLQISILNASTGLVYQIQQSGSLDSSSVWTQQFLTTPGQTNFILTPLSNSNQFFRAY